MRNPVCEGCGGKWITKISNATNLFIARYIDTDKYGTFDRQPFMRHEGYLTEGVIQWSQELKHFRCLKVINKAKVKVYLSIIFYL